MPRKIVLTGGGTAGHVNPHLAIIPMLKAENYAISYIGSKNGMERQIIEAIGIPYYGISSGKLRRYFSLRNFTDPFRVLRGYFQSKKILKHIGPDILFSKGGYVSVPVVFAAHKLHIPVIIHESDYSPGLANKLCVPKAQRVCLSFQAASKGISAGKVVVTGSPVRETLFHGDRENGLHFLGFAGKKPVLLVMGGSLGALYINNVLDQIMDWLLERFDIVHVRGIGKCNPILENRQGYRQFEYINKELPDVFAATDLMLSRAGANTIFEILALHIPNLLIPLPLGASRGDQILNAEYFEKMGYSKVLRQEDLTSETLKKALLSLEEDAPQLQVNMKNSSLSNGAKNVVNVIFSVAGN